ncbi:proline-rich protein 2-like [Vulpes lagopus]|uniref:proline-rich protein 2-like n=1 Tax=Vulpes lagopus TaxID=494514 RepID=UPI001BC8C9BE|nr:proline-rich protein 2-like [Vulpes lagopus]
MGAPPPRVVAPGPRGERSCPGGKGPQGRRPRVRTRPAARSAGCPAGPGAPALPLPAGGAPDLPGGRRARAPGPPPPSPAPRLGGGAPPSAWDGSPAPRGRAEGAPQGHPERPMELPDRPERGAGRGGARCPPPSPMQTPPPSPGPDPAPRELLLLQLPAPRERVIEPGRASNPVLPGGPRAEPGTRRAGQLGAGRGGCISASQNRKPSRLRAHVIGFHIMGPCSRSEAPTSSPRPRAPGAASESPSVQAGPRAPGYQAPLTEGLSREGACR